MKKRNPKQTAPDATTSADSLSHGLEAVRSTYPNIGPGRDAAVGCTRDQRAGVFPANSSSLRTDASVDLPGAAITPQEESAEGAAHGDMAVRSTPDIRIVEGPMSILLPYQVQWALDESRWKCGIMSRQVGKDMASGAEGIADIFQAELRGEKKDWIIAAPSERQALESLNKWKDWAQAFELAIDDIDEQEIEGEIQLKSTTITFPGGSRVIAVPGKPPTVRGLSGNLLMTEFGFFENADATWKAVLPSITNPLRGGEKKVRLISTPNGQGNKLHDIWSKNYGNPKGRWSCHLVTIEDAVRMGLPIDLAELKEAIDDPSTWDQEFMCQFIDTASVLLPYDLIYPCEAPLATQTIDPGYFERARNHFVGIDYGRSRDLTVVWTVEMLPGGYAMTKEVLTLRNMPAPEQVAIITPRIRHCTRAVFDWTGGGEGVGDYLVSQPGVGEYAPTENKFGRLEKLKISNAVKCEYMTKMRIAFERKLVGIPCDRAIREDLHSIYRIALSAGGVTYRAPHTPDGHADRATALGLALRATEFSSVTGRILTFSNSRTARSLAARRERSIEG